MKKLFRTSKSTTQAPTDGSGDKSDVKSDVKKEKETKKKKSKPSSLSSKSLTNAQSNYLAISNIPQLARASDAEALATALAAEVVADNADAGIPVLLKNIPPRPDPTAAPGNRRRSSVLKQPGVTRLNSISSEGEDDEVSLASPPHSPRSNSVTSQGRPRVHFDVSEKIILEAQWYSHQQRFTINSGNFLHFERPPTANYRFSTTAESIHTKGTLLQLVTSANSDDDKNTWDSITGLPLYAARYYNPNVALTDRTVYWEAQIRSLGVSKFSSVDNSDGSPVSRTAPSGKPVGSPPSSPKPIPTLSGEGSLADLGLSRSISHTYPVSNRITGAAIAIGFVVKSVTPDTVPFIRRRSSLRPIDEFPFPCSTAGGGVFWSSENGGSIYIDGHPTKHSLAAGVGDTIGIGITYKVDSEKQPSNGATPVPTPPTTPPPVTQKESKELFRRKSSVTNGKDEVPYAEPKDLQPVSTEVFFVVNGEKKLTISHPHGANNPFDTPLPDYLLGINDVFPCICVQGAGIECKTRIGQAVTWRGEGGSTEPPVEEVKHTEAKEVPKETPKETPKKSGRWWSHLGHHGHSNS
ncbi:uncharacterized protein DFL_008000 [Arthrobotrys flagrans]|uniref:SPRY domain-containing protein n=1 Tax=Arthrobotrys flagrans TaxID=97331 RepID=A0A436ZXI2_ARTFL|nr:hypothetical protein DFL_008000 [Arthrobotrys flagrans]